MTQQEQVSNQRVLFDALSLCWGGKHLGRREREAVGGGCSWQEESLVGGVHLGVMAVRVEPNSG